LLLGRAAKKREKKERRRKKSKGSCGRQGTFSRRENKNGRKGKRGAGGKNETFRDKAFILTGGKSRIPVGNGFATARRDSIVGKGGLEKKKRASAAEEN